MSALLLTLPLGKYFGFDEIWDDATAVEGLRQVGEAGQACYWIHHKVAAPLRIAAPEGCTTCRQACTRGLAEWDEECRAFECGTGYCAIFAHDVSDSRAVPLAELEGGAGGRPADLKCYRKATYEFHQLFQQYDADGREMTGCGWKEAWDTEERYYQRFDAGTCGTCGLAANPALAGRAAGSTTTPTTTAPSRGRPAASAAAPRPSRGPRRRCTRT